MLKRSCAPAGVTDLTLTSSRFNKSPLGRNEDMVFGPQSIRQTECVPGAESIRYQNVMRGRVRTHVKSRSTRDEIREDDLSDDLPLFRSDGRAQRFAHRPRHSGGQITDRIPFQLEAESKRCKRSGYRRASSER